MTHQAVAENFNVSKITISMLIVRLQQTGRTNDLPSNDRPRVTSKRQDRRVRLIYHRNRIITTEDTVRRTPGLANVRYSSQTVR